MTGFMFPILRSLSGNPMVAEPGIVWRYNNGSAEVMGALLKKVAAKPIDRSPRRCCSTR